MKKKIRLSEQWLIFGYFFILLFMIVQDWVPLGIFNDIEAITALQSAKELMVVTLINVAQIILLLGIIITFVGRRYPIWVKLWLVIHPSCIFVGVMISWWIPYLLGVGAEEKVDRYQQMFGNTHSFLPIMHGIVPNTLHTIFHLTLLFCIIISMYIFFSNNKYKIKSE